jgi:hypothetical protein
MSSNETAPLEDDRAGAVVFIICGKERAMSHKPPKEQRKKPAMTLKEKRAMKREKKQPQPTMPSPEAVA